jgi:uncharacterized protein (TIGR03437 family)
MSRRLSAFIVPAGLLISSVVAFAQSQPRITNSTLAGGEVTVGYNQAVQVTGGITPYTWSQLSGTLPPTLSLNQATGAITGTPTTPGLYTFTIQVSDSQGQMTSQTYTNVQIFSAIGIATTTLPNGAFGDSYSQSLSTSGGNGSLTWSIVSGALPNNVTLNSSTGLVSGTPSPPNGFPPNTALQVNVTVGVTDALGGTASQFYGPLINPALAIGTTILPVGVQGTAYDQSLSATGGSGTLTWSNTGSLPPGLTLNTSTGAITGTPTSYGSYTFNAIVNDSNGGSANQSITLAVDIANRLITTNLPNGMAIVNISGTQDGAGSFNGAQTIWFQPFNLNSPTAQLLEYTVPAGTYTFRVIDPADAASIFPNLTSPQLTEIWTSWTYNSPWVTPYLVFPSTAATNNSVGQLFSGAENGPGFTGDNATQLAYDYAITNGLYNELFVGTRNNASPVTQYTFASEQTLIFAVPDNDPGDNGGGVSVLIAPLAATQLSLTGETLSAGQAGSTYGPAQVTGASGGSGNYVWSVSSVTGAGLPAGLALSPAGSLSGIPTVSGSFPNVQFIVTDPVSGATASALFPITISTPANPLTITTTSPLPAATLNSVYSQTIAATGGVGSYTWSMTPVGAASGLSIAPSTGALSGTITTPGTYTLNVTVSDTVSDQISMQFTVSALAPLSLSPASLPNATEGQEYSQNLTVSGGSGHYRWTIVSQSTGLNLSLHPSWGATVCLKGTPDVSSDDVAITIRVTDTSTGQSISHSYSLAVNAPEGVPTGAQPIGTTAYILNEDQSLVSLNGGNGTTLAPGVDCRNCFAEDMARDSSGNFIAAAGNQIIRYSSTGAPLDPIYAPDVEFPPNFASLAIDSSGNYIVADNSNHQILRILSTSPYTIQNVAQYSVDDPDSEEDVIVRVDASGNYIVAEDNNLQTEEDGAMSLFRVTPGGAITAIPLSSGGGDPTPAGLGGMTFDARGNYVVTDWSNEAVYTIAPFGAANAGTFTVLYANSEVFCDPLGIYRDPLSGLFFLVDDGNDAVYTLTPDGATLTQIASGELFNGGPIAVVVADDSGPVTTDFVLQTNAGIIPVPTGQTISCSQQVCGEEPDAADLTLDAAGNFIAANGSQLVKITRAGVSSVINTAPDGSNWRSVAIDSFGNFIVADDGRHRVVRISPDGQTTTSVASYTVANADNEEDAIVRVDGQGNYIVAEDNGSDDLGPVQIYKISPSGTVTNLTLTGSVPNTVGGMTFDAQANYVITDFDAALVDVVDATTGAVSVLFSNPNEVLDNPLGIYRDLASGNYLIVNDGDSDQDLYSLSSNGTQLTLLDGSLNNPVAVVSVSFAVTTPSLPSGVPNQTYTQVTMTATGGSGNYTWSATGLPANLTISTAGVISGTPMGASQSNVAVFVTDTSTNQTAGRTYLLTVAIPTPPATTAPLTISTSSLPNGSVNQPYSSVTLGASGGSGGYLWSASGLPPGMTLSGGGVLSGTPSAAGTFSVFISVRDTSSDSAGVYLSLTTAYPPLSVITAALPNGAVGQSYGPVTVSATGGSGTYTWSMIGSPPGVSISNVGVLSGATLLPLAAGTYSPTVTVGDTKANLTASQIYSVVIAPGALTLNGPLNLGGFAPGAGVSAAYSATGGQMPYTWSATGLPAGLALNPSTGSLTGSITAPGNYAFQVQVMDSQPKSVTGSANVSLFVLGIATTSLPNGTVKSAYSQSLSAAGGSPPYSWSVSGGTLPDGLSLSPGGVLSGTPTVTGTIPPAGITSSFSVSVTNGGVTVSAPLTLTVTSNLLPLKTSGGPLPDGNVSTPYSQTLDASNGKPPYSWSLLGGTLPGGLSLDGSGTLLGTPNRAGSYAFTAQVTDTAGASASGSFTITIDPALLTITTGPQLPNGIVDTSYPTQVITAKGGTPPYTFKAGGALPDGLVFSNGQLSGTPTTNSDSSFTVTVADSTQPTPSTATASFQISIEPFHVDLVLSQDLVQLSLIAGAQSLPAATSSGSVTVSSNGQTLSYSVTPDSATWLDVTSPGTTPGAIGISLDPANAPKLAAGNYSSSITVACVTPAGAGQPSPCEGNTQTVAVTLNVTAAPPQLITSPDVLSFSVQSANSQPVSQALTLQNAGGGTISGISVTSPDSFVTISDVPQTIPADGSAYVTVTVNPAGLSAPLSQSTVAVTTSAGSVNVPLTLLIAQKPTLTLIPAGTQFQTQIQNSVVAPLGNANGSFQVGVTGTAPVTWTASVLPGANWLQLNTTSGASTGSIFNTVNFSVNVSALPVTAQPNYGTIRVTSSAVSDATQDFLVVLNVAPATNPVQPNVIPGGLVFIGNGTGALPPQTVQVTVSSTTSVTYSASPNAPWLQVSPASDSVSSAAAGSSSVSVDPTGLKPGTYTGQVSYQLAGSGTGSGVIVSNAVRSVNVTLIVQGAGAAASGRGGPTPKAACAPSQLIPTQTGLVNNFSQPASWPTPLAIQLTDNCGNSVTNGQVVATFSNGDPPLALAVGSTASGVYSGTWTPRSTAGQITIAARATAQGFPAATAQIAGQVTPNAAPVLNPNGTLNVFAPVVGAPLAPGAIVQIYGSNLAAQAAPATTIPLPTSLNQTSVIIGGMPAPLYYVSPGQINAQVPFELTPGNPYQLIVVANGALSTPNPIQLASAAPGIAQFAAGQVIAQHLDGSLVLETSPAAPGEYIVFYIAGMGQTNQNIASGAASPSGDNLAVPIDAPALTLNGEPVTNILFVGLTPTLVGLYQMDFQVPSDAPNGDLPLVLTQSSGFSNSSILPVQAPASQ